LVFDIGILRPFLRMGLYAGSLHCLAKEGYRVVHVFPLRFDVERRRDYFSKRSRGKFAASKPIKLLPI